MSITFRTCQQLTPRTTRAPDSQHAHPRSPFKRAKMRIGVPLALTKAGSGAMPVRPGGPARDACFGCPPQPESPDVTYIRQILRVFRPFLCFLKPPLLASPPCLFSTHVLRKDPCKSICINKSGIFSRHTFVPFGSAQLAGHPGGGPLVTRPLSFYAPCPGHLHPLHFRVPEMTNGQTHRQQGSHRDNGQTKGTAGKRQRQQGNDGED